MSNHTDTPDLPRQPREPDPIEIRRERRAMVLRRLALVLGSVALVSMLGLLLYVAIAVRTTQLNNTNTLDSADRAARDAAAAAESAETGTARIQDCTTPGQPCYQDGQRRTAAAVSDLNRVIVLAAACADRPGDQTVVEIQTCVIAKLAQQENIEGKARP